MGLMSIVNSLASSPIGKVAGGFLEGEIDERKEAARLQEEKALPCPKRSIKK